MKESSVISEPRFILSEGLPPVPPKLQKRDFVDTAELLWELGRRQNLEAGRGGGAHISRREVHEACRCGGKGWQVYDSMFRQQAANNPKVNWSVLNSFLYSTSFLAMRGRACQHCMETDHASQACALAPTLVSKTGQGKGSPGSTATKEGKEQRYGEPALIGMRKNMIFPTVALSTCVQSVGATIGSISAEVQP